MTTLYLKYRSQRIEDLDIDTVRESLLSMVEGDIPHALLFSGPRGTGKTSAARILAKYINCESQKNKPCNKCDSCKSITSGTNVDVVEMDAASNRGIDDIRTLRDYVKLSPAKSKAKVYIVDEAHMLTTEASNALLKTLEEPPSHVYFVLATTNPEKIIETIKSRTTQVVFTKATSSEISRALKRVAKGENIKITDQEILKINKLAKGSFRDAVKILEQFANDSKVLENVFSNDVEELFKLILEKKEKESLEFVRKATDSGLRAEELSNDLISVIRTKLLKEKEEELITLLEMIMRSQEFIKYSPVDELPLEMVIIRWCKMGIDGR